MARLKRAPVFFTLAQMRFNPFLELGPILPALQDAFRKEGYPDYEAAKVQGIAFQQDTDGFSLNQKAVIRHIFCNKGRTKAILLDTAALTYELTDYPVFAEFSQAFADALRIVHEHRAIEYCDRLGMRMLDAVQPLAGESLGQYVLPQALGLDVALEGAHREHALTESIFKWGSRTLVMRTIRVSEGLLVPNDLAPLRIEIAPRFGDYEGEGVILDTDCYQDGRTDFSMNTAIDDLTQLKVALSRCFKSLVTTHALRVWE
mgnify:CR=1 FL=1